MNNWSKEERISAGSKSLLLFAIIYFPHYFKNKCAPFHREMCALIDSLNRHEYKFLLEIAFRESAKTSYAKIDFIRNICYGWSKMMFYTCYESEASENNLLDIALELQTNKYLINDFGQLFFGDDGGERRSQKKGMANFITTNGARVQASTVKKTLRGQIFQAQRPDYMILDDIENDKTKNSSAMTRTTISFIEEMIGGLDENAKVIILGNRVSDCGSITNCEERFRGNKDARIFEKALIENGQITWDRFTWDWIESKKSIMNVSGIKRFEQEYLNQPIVDGDRLFDINKIDDKIAIAKGKHYEERGKWKIWKEMTVDRYEGPHVYVMSADISQGFGLDSSTIQVLDLFNGEQVAEFESNSSSPSDLVDQIIWAHGKYNQPLFCPENNSIGQAVISVLKERGLAHIMFVEEKIDNITGGKTNRYGWNTNSKTKPKMIFDLVQAVNDDLIIINSVLALKEMRSFSNRDIDYSTFDPELSRHFDRVMSLAIAWQMRNKSTAFKIVKSYDPLEKVPYASDIHSGKVIEKTIEKDQIILKRIDNAKRRI